MRVRVGSLMMALFALSGCAPAASFANPAGLSGVASMIGSVGATATGFRATQSAAELNGANAQLAEAQTLMMHTQVEQNRNESDRLARERATTTKLLRGMAGTYHEPIFETLAEWVEAGGDPDFAFKYALAHVDEDERTKVLPQQPALIKPQEPPAPILPAIHSPQTTARAAQETAHSSIDADKDDAEKNGAGDAKTSD